jgi:polyhydroxyalkanoate synthesis regulator phasin
MLKELLYTSVGVATIFKEKVEDELTKLEEKGKIKKDDAKSFLESLEKKGKEEDERFKTHLKSTLKEIIDELGVATKDDLDKLKEELKK